MTQRHGIWRHIGKNIRSSSKSSNGAQRSKRTDSKGFWNSVSDTVFFTPSKDPMLKTYRDMYRLNRQIGELEHSLTQQAVAAGTGMGNWMKRKLLGAWHEIVDETKALGMVKVETPASNIVPILKVAA